MKTLLNIFKGFVLLLLFWVLVFDFQRILFSIHNFDKAFENGFWEWILVFFHSIRLDLATGAALSILPLVILSCYFIFRSSFLYTVFKVTLIFEVVIVSMIHGGEINAYTEWNHKLTSRVFMHLSHPDEVFRTADYGMTLWFIFYLVLEVVFGFKIMRWLFKKDRFSNRSVGWISGVANGLISLPLFLGVSFILARGGLQQIPINIDSAYFSKNYVINDISVNSPYFFAKSYLLYNRSNIDEYISSYPKEKVERLLSDFYNYSEVHDNYILENKHPNLVFVILESWTATVSEKLSGEPGGTPEFDRFAEEGVLFTNLYATGSTSEIGNASIFSGYPALPEISISMQPFKHRKLTSLNESLDSLSYSSGYLFSGDLKYGNIEGYFSDHGFDRLEDESDFPSGLPRGKLNYYDEDLYDLFLNRINSSSEPFLQCAFTGSTHSPYDYPEHNKEPWTGDEADFMNSVIYADQCLADFIDSCKQYEWYDNTLFIMVADHGHASPYIKNPSDSEFYHIPLLLYGTPLKKDVKGTIIDKVGSQADIAATLLYQMNIDREDYYPWSKDLLNPNTPEFALHATTRGFGWVTPKGNFTYHLDFEQYLVNSFDKEQLPKERERCNAFMQAIYEHYKAL
jgi:phosphoglycerol transferase MdoB-like AlkP superfamily enzyme